MGNTPSTGSGMGSLTDYDAVYHSNRSSATIIARFSIRAAVGWVEYFTRPNNAKP
jgi:hypothetical protein